MKANELLELLRGLENVHSVEDMAKFLKDCESKSTKQEEEKEEKYYEYTTKLTKAVMKVFTEEESPLFIDVKELSEDDNSDQFIHSLANIMPATVIHFLSEGKDDDLDSIDRNSKYLRLILKYAKPHEKK